MIGNTGFNENHASPKTEVVYFAHAKEMQWKINFVGKMSDVAVD